MFSLGWMEISIILIITIVIVGPKEIPTVIRFIKNISSGIKKVSKEFSSTVDELTNLDEIKDIKKGFRYLKKSKNDINDFYNEWEIFQKIIKTAS